MTTIRPAETGERSAADPGFDEAVAVAASLLGSATSVLLLAHVQPDADALGSALALGLALSRKGVPSVVSFAEPDAVPASLTTLPGTELVLPSAQVLATGPTAFDLVVTLDVGSAERLGSLAAVIDWDIPVLVVDHHASNTGFGTHQLIDPAAEATVVLVDLLLQRLELPVDHDIAALLYAGLATDTAGFRHTSAHGHALAARLIQAGVRPDELLRPITDSHPFGWFTMLSTVLGRAALDQDAASGRGLVHTRVTLADADGLGQEELDSVIDILRTASEAKIAMVAKQTDADRWQVSLRGTSGVDVGTAATALGGGGHARAAGYTHFGSYDEALANLIRALA